MPPAAHVIGTADGRIHTLDWQAEASGAPLILLHDSLGSLALRHDLPAQLAATTGRRLIAYDRRGLGPSDPRTDRLNPPRILAAKAGGDFAAVTTALNIPRFALPGHSVGGGMGLHIAARPPDRTEALVTIAAQSFAEARMLDAIRRPRADGRPHAARPPCPPARPAHRPGAVGMDRQMAGPGLCASGPRRRAAPRAPCPVLAVHRDADDDGSRAHPDRITALAGGPVTLHLMAGEGHFPHRSNAPATIALIADFLKGTT